MSSVVTGAIIGASIGLIYSGYILLSAGKKKGDKYLKEMTRRVTPLEAPMPPAAVFAALRNGIIDHPATLEAADEAATRLVFTDKASMTTFGFFYPIHITPSAQGAHLDIGIISRGNQWGPLVTKAHRIFVEGVCRTLGLPEPS